jgi:hypothetical protein
MRIQESYTCFIQQKYLHVPKVSHSSKPFEIQRSKMHTVHSRQAVKKGLTHYIGTCTHRSQKRLKKWNTENSVEIRNTQLQSSILKYNPRVTSSHKIKYWVSQDDKTIITTSSTTPKITMSKQSCEQNTLLR